MNLEIVLQFVERLLTRRQPKVIAGTFFTFSMAIVFVGYWRGFPAPTIFLTVLAAAVVSLVAIGLRWLEKRCPEPDEVRRFDN